MKKPLILCTRATLKENRVGVNIPYAQAIQNAGGVLLMLTHNIDSENMDALLENVSGLLIPGGTDINPARYNETRKEYSGDPDDDRDRLELDLIDCAMKKGIPILAICRGFQILNVKFNGTLYQDLEKEMIGSIKHDNHDGKRSELVHDISVKSGSLLAKIFGTETIRVNSLHHQGIKSIGEGLVAIGHVPDDNLIEAFEMPGYPYLLGVQWHPEELRNDPLWGNLFENFVSACIK